MRKTSDYNTRLKKLAESLNLTPRAFCVKCGIESNYLTHARQDLTTKVLIPIYRRYPNINLYWLLFGEGEDMFIDNSPESIAANRFVFTEFRNLQTENRQLIAENAVLKSEIKRLQSTENQQDI
jgi:hypothetical protein